ncbi:hypothetical protein PLESTM_001865000 [Pleodorina starrii]|nr:hypothetical protein PLESTM_001865000 [Pleodorina starrii]
MSERRSQQPPPPDTNIILTTANMTVQSSTVLNNNNILYGPLLAIDGVIPTADSNASTYISGTPDTSPWFSIDFGELVTINRVVYYNRRDCCGDNVTGLNMRFGGSSVTRTLFVPSFNPTFYNAAGTSSTTGAVITVNLSPPWTGRVLSLHVLPSAGVPASAGAIGFPPLSPLQAPFSVGGWPGFSAGVSPLQPPALGVDFGPLVPPSSVPLVGPFPGVSGSVPASGPSLPGSLPAMPPVRLMGASFFSPPNLGFSVGFPQPGLAGQVRSGFGRDWVS